LNYAYGQFQLERRRTNSGKSGAVQLCWRYVVTFPDEGAPQTPPGYSPRPRSPQSPRCLDQCRAFDACDCCDASTRLQFSPNFYYFYICLSVLKMYWVVLTADCRNSVCRNRICRNSVCLPSNAMGTDSATTHNIICSNISLTANKSCKNCSMND